MPKYGGSGINSRWNRSVGMCSYHKKAFEVLPNGMKACPDCAEDLKKLMQPALKAAKERDNAHQARRRRDAERNQDSGCEDGSISDRGNKRRVPTKRSRSISSEYDAPDDGVPRRRRGKRDRSDTV